MSRSVVRQIFFYEKTGNSLQKKRQFSSIPGLGIRENGDRTIPNSGNRRSVKGNWMSDPIRILIADDHAFLRTTLSRVLSSKDDMTVVGEAENGTKVVELTDSLSPDVVLMDYDMPEMNGVEAIHHILATHPKVVVIGFSMHDKEVAEPAMIRAGARAFLTKGESLEVLLTTIRQHVET